MRANSNSIRTALVALTALLLATLFAGAADKVSSSSRRRNTTVFDWENLQSDIAGVGEQKDPNVINPWGITLSSFGNVWVADNGAGVATVYFQDGTPFPSSANPLVVTIPPSATNTEDANHTGIVSN